MDDSNYYIVEIGTNKKYPRHNAPVIILPDYVDLALSDANKGLKIYEKITIKEYNKLFR